MSCCGHHSPGLGLYSSLTSLGEVVALGGLQLNLPGQMLLKGAFWHCSTKGNTTMCHTGAGPMDANLQVWDLEFLLNSWFHSKSLRMFSSEVHMLVLLNKKSPELRPRTFPTSSTYFLERNNGLFPRSGC
jgi:hypothetical protein